MNKIEIIKNKTLSIKDGFLKLSLIKKIGIIGILVVFFYFIILPVFAQSSNQPQYQTSQVTKGSIISTLSESGNISGSQTNVTSPTTGVIQDVYVKNGDDVYAGQPLFTVKSTATAQDIASAWASYQNALVSANNAEASKISAQAKLEQDRQAVINASSAVTTMQNNISTTTSNYNPATKQSYTQNDIDAINSALTSARETFNADEQKYLQSDTAISAARASQYSAWLAYKSTQDSTVTAPINGTVANFSAGIGSNVTASVGGNSSASSNSSSASNASSPIMVIGNFSNMQVTVQASEVDVPNIHAGQKATVTLDALPDKTFVGTVSSVDNIGSNNSGVVTYNVYVNLLSSPAEIKPGMSATVTIQTNRKDNVLKVSTSAIQTNTNGSYVRVLNNGNLTEVPVETGTASDSETEIVSGLSEGVTVVTNIITQNRTSGQTTSPFSSFGNRGFGGASGGGTVRTNSGNGNRVFINTGR